MHYEPTKISREELALAIYQVERSLDPANSRERELQARVVAAALFMVSHTLDIPDDVRAEWEREGVGRLLASLTGWGLRNLKKVAEGVTLFAEGATPSAPPLH
jgi:hypothetical protein